MQPLKGLKIGLLKEFFDEGLDPENRQRIRDALEVLREQGAVLKEVSLPNLPLSVPTYYVVAPAECSSNLARFDGVRYGYRCERSARSAGPVPALARRRLRRRGQAPHHDRHLRAVRRLLRCLLPEGPARARADQRGLRARLPRGRCRHRPDHADAGLRARRQDGRSGDDVPERHLHHRRQPRRPAGDVGAVRTGPGTAGGPADHRSALSGSGCSTSRIAISSETDWHRRAPPGFA